MNIGRRKYTGRNFIIDPLFSEESCTMMPNSKIFIRAQRPSYILFSARLHIVSSCACFFIYFFIDQIKTVILNERRHVARFVLARYTLGHTVNVHGTPSARSPATFVFLVFDSVLKLCTSLCLVLSC